MPASFLRAYATLAAQRASKILGIFARLDRRDGKPQYLRHIPRVWNYLQRSLAHPSLARAARLVRTHPTSRNSQIMNDVPRRAMVLAAGLGERMRPITERMPKPLVPVAGKPLIDHVLDRLAAAGVETAVVNVHYLADQIERHLAARRAPRIVISDERAQLLDTGGGVVSALGSLGAEPFFHINSDTIWIDGAKSNLLRLAEAFDPARMDALAAARASRGQHRLCRPRRFRHGAGRLAAAPGRARGRAIRLCRARRSCRRCCLRTRPRDRFR